MTPNVLIQPAFKEFEQYLNFARQNQLKFEIVDFAYPHILDDPILRKQRIDYYLQFTDQIISLHGVFFDIHPESMDPRIEKVSQERIIDNLDIAQSLECEYIVFHTSFNPLINLPRYTDNWMNKQAEFWVKILTDRNIKVVLENVFEFNPQYLFQLLQCVNIENLGWCLDTGHLNLYSRVESEEWLELLKDRLFYVHLNDNLGQSDQHLPCGQGTYNWKEYDRLIRKYHLNPVTVLETSGIEPIAESLEFLNYHRIYPFSSIQ